MHLFLFMLMNKSHINRSRLSNMFCLRMKMFKITDRSPPGAMKLSRTFAAASLYYTIHKVKSASSWKVHLMIMAFMIQRLCRRLHEEIQWPRPQWITFEFGGTNTEFSNGLQDPWS